LEVWFGSNDFPERVSRNKRHSKYFRGPRFLQLAQTFFVALRE
jgi:hypothetical protein